MHDQCRTFAVFFTDVGVFVVTIMLNNYEGALDDGCGEDDDEHDDDEDDGFIFRRGNSLSAKIRILRVNHQS